MKSCFFSNHANPQPSKESPWYTYHIPSLFCLWHPQKKWCGKQPPEISDSQNTPFFHAKSPWWASTPHFSSVKTVKSHHFSWFFSSQTSEIPPFSLVFPWFSLVFSSPNPVKSREIPLLGVDVRAVVFPWRHPGLGLQRTRAAWIICTILWMVWYSIFLAITIFMCMCIYICIYMCVYNHIYIYMWFRHLMDLEVKKYCRWMIKMWFKHLFRCWSVRQTSKHVVRCPAKIRGWSLYLHPVGVSPNIPKKMLAKPCKVGPPR